MIRKYRNCVLGILMSIILIELVCIIVFLFKNERNEQCFYINEVVTSSFVELEVTNVENSKILGDEILYERTNFNFVIITININNQSPVEISLYDYCFLLIGEDEVLTIHNKSWYLENGFYMVEDILPNCSKNLRIAFETPTPNFETSPYILQIKIGDYAKAQNILLKRL